MSYLAQHNKTETSASTNPRKNNIQNNKYLILPAIPNPHNLANNQINREFTLSGLYNASLPQYNPKKDKNLKYFFHKDTVKKIIEKQEKEEESIRKQRVGSSNVSPKNSPRERRGIRENGSTLPLKNYENGQRHQNHRSVMTVERKKHSHSLYHDLEVHKVNENQECKDVITKEDFAQYLEKIKKKITTNKQSIEVQT